MTTTDSDQRSPTAEPSESELHRLFGTGASLIPLTSENRMGRRITGIDLSGRLSAEQAALLVSLLDRHRIVSFAGQDELGFTVHDLERLANHFGAVIPHPKNYANYQQRRQDADIALELLPVEQRTSTLVDQAFPGEIECIDGADSPAVYIVTNLVGSGPDRQPELAGGQHWHTDIEFEPIPLSTSMFYVQRAPLTRDSAEGNWVTNPVREEGFYHPESPRHLSELREALPLNGETAYTDTAAAYAAFSPEEKAELDGVMVRRRLRPGDPGWLIPLVHRNPRTGVKSLHSPVWASRGRRIAPAEIHGLTDDNSRHFLDGLEAHCLQPQFRYDHAHTPGDVTVWSNFATMHTAPPAKRVVDAPDDARLMYRISCKGEPSHELPRSDSDQWIESNIVPPYRSPISSTGDGRV